MRGRTFEVELTKTNSVGQKENNMEASLEIQSKIRTEIPMAEFMDFTLQLLDQTNARASIPLPQNSNHLGTGFGGSLYSFGALSCYSVVLCNLAALRIENPYVVIASGEIEYLKPARGDMTSNVSLDQALHAEFLDSFHKRGVAKLPLVAGVFSEGQECAKFVGQYVVKKNRR